MRWGEPSDGANLARGRWGELSEGANIAWGRWGEHSVGRGGVTIRLTRELSRHNKQQITN